MGKTKIFGFINLILSIVALLLLCGGVVKASCLDDNFNLKTKEEKINCLTSVIADLTAQLNQQLAQQNNTQNWCHTFNRNLGFADSGSDEVSALHKALQKEGILYGLDGDTLYVEGTGSAVVKFQQKYSISPLSGYVGPKTRAQLNLLYGCSSTPIQTPVACTPNWQCGNWGSCLNGQQTRNCNDLNDCGVAMGEPLTRSCSSICVPNWSCTGYANSPCVNGSQTQTCVDSNNCGTTGNEPALIQSCTNQSSVTNSTNINAPIITRLSASSIHSINCDPTGGFPSFIIYGSGFKHINKVNFCNLNPLASINCESWETPGSSSDTEMSWESRVGPGTYDLSVVDLVTHMESNKVQITIGPDDPSIAFTFPAGGETLTEGQTYNIKWNFACLNPNSTIGLDLVYPSGGSREILFSGQLSSGLYSWQVPPDLIPGSYKIRLNNISALNDFSGSTVFSSSVKSVISNAFTIVAPPPPPPLPTLPVQNQPSITITSPSGEAPWVYEEKNHIITWTSKGFSSDAQVAINLQNFSNGNPNDYSLVSHLPVSQGNYSYIVSPLIENGGYDLKVCITDPDNELVPDGGVCDSTYVVIDYLNNPNDPYIVITSPTINQTLINGQTYDISWTTQRPPRYNKYLDLFLQLAYNDGWVTQTQGAVYNVDVSSSGKYSWKVPVNMYRGSYRLAFIRRDKLFGASGIVGVSDLFNISTSPKISYNLPQSSLSSISGSLQLIAKEVAQLLGK